MIRSTETVILRCRKSIIPCGEDCGILYNIVFLVVNAAPVDTIEGILINGTEEIFHAACSVCGLLPGSDGILRIIIVAPDGVQIDHIPVILGKVRHGSTVAVDGIFKVGIGIPSLEHQIRISALECI